MILRVLKSIFKPSYGDTYQVSPTRWWSRKDRKSARLSAKVLGYDSPVLHEEAMRVFRNEMLYGERRDEMHDLLYGEWS